MSFLGYRRFDGSVGTRNYVGIISTVSCANDVSWAIAQATPGTAPFLHGQGCAQTQPDQDIVTRTLINVGRHPNLAGVLLVSLGCESVSVERIAEEIAISGKRVGMVRVQDEGSSKATELGLRFAEEMVEEAREAKREECDDSELCLGIKCGASDTTSGLAANPVTGVVCDKLVDAGGACVFGETTEFIGAEHILARRAATPEVGRRVLEIVDRMERRAVAMGFDLRGGQPTAGNIAGGLTTIEEKSLGAIVKSGTRPVQAVYEYGERPDRKGLLVVDTPGREPEFLAALAAAGCQVVIFTTGLGAPQGFPFIPVIKVTANPKTHQRLGEHIDTFVDITGHEGEGLASAGSALYGEMLDVASGKQTKAEVNKYGTFPNIYTIGPVV